MSAGADDISSMLNARAAQGTDTSDIGAMLSARAAGGMQAPPEAPKATAPTRGERFGQGFMDLPTGMGQIAEHVAETPLNGIRTVIRGGLNAVGAKDAAALFAPVKTGEFDDIVQQREQDYQKARSDAQQTGIDWWRLGGQAANPINYLAPEGAGATVAGRIGLGATQGAAISAAQPSTTPGDFWWDKAKGAAIGGAAGGATAGVIEAAVPVIRKGVAAARNILGSEAASSPAADAIVNSALHTNGMDPNAVNVNVLAGMKKDAQDALEHGVDPSPQMIALRTKAESLPYPFPFMRGQASGDAMQFAKEQNLRGIQGVGEPITQRLTDQNAVVLNNLDVLGAKDAPDPVSTGHAMAEKVQGFWDQVQAKKTALYDAVKNSKGQPAAMDQFTAAQNIKDALDTPQAGHSYDLLPENIKRTIEDLHDGSLPLTVGQMQSLDKMWGSAQHGADGSTAYAIGVARRELNNAPISDEVGQEAQQAYQAARSAHAEQMAMVDPKLPNGMPNPKFQPLVKAVVMDGKPPETLFQTHFMGASPSVAKKNLDFLSSIDPNSPETIGKTFMGEVKRLALNNASDERGTISQSVLTGFARDPVKSARMDALMPEPAVQTYRNLADVVEAAKRYPTASAVNTSNTGSAVVNAATSALKGGALEKLSGVVGKIPVVGPLLNAKDIAKTMETSRLQTEVQGALNPGVTLKSLLRATPSQAAARKLAGRAIIPATTAATKETLDTP
jgi:hypothetical protein